MRHTTAFNIKRHHIHLTPSLVDQDGVTQVFRAILDTGAPRSEFSDRFLRTVKILPTEDLPLVSIPEGLQTKKYASVILPSIECLGRTLEDFSVVVSRFEEHWGGDALIGLDFFRQFRVTIDYKMGQIVTETY